jgi:aspartyl/asparaginyl-tRNA synthetase
MHRSPWKTARGPSSIEEGKTHGFRKYLKVFIVGRYFLSHHGCMEHSQCMDFLQHIYILGQQFRIKESNKGNHLNL